MLNLDTGLLAQLEEALNKDDNWKEQIYLSLQGISRVLSSFQAVKNYYDNLSIMDSSARPGHLYQSPNHNH
ncbi:hypothetical protein HHE02_04520 [Helicobacter heilmannii]|nr:hypothetical protein HHE02_04520 [Helicobacter heilmannii]